VCNSKLCELCKGSLDGRDKSSLRGLALCYACDSGLAKGKFSAEIVATELRSMKAGGFLKDRPPLPAAIREQIWGTRDQQAAGTMARAAARQTARQAAPQAAQPLECIAAARIEPATIEPPQPLPAAPAMIPAPEPPASQPQAAAPEPEAERPQFRARMPRQRKQRKRIIPQDAPNWRENAARLAMAIYV
jgi:hypothetical protein